MMRASPSAPTPTPPGSNRTEQRKLWEILWHRLCRAEKAEKSQARSSAFLPGTFDPFSEQLYSPVYRKQKYQSIYVLYPLLRLHIKVCIELLKHNFTAPLN